MSAFKRLGQGGRIDRAKPVRFTLDGRAFEGFAGDTLTTALLANGIVLQGRSFKYHRPRGPVSMGVEEPNALFTIGHGARQEPNIAGTTLPLVEGLQARSQNAWPSLNHDVMAVNQWAGSILGAGFYYKTFMGPFKKSWMWYEPMIRRAAGLGKVSTEHDAARHDVQHDFCDVIIIGSGPAGLSAACAAGRSGLRVLLVEQDSALGGSLLASSGDALENWRNAALAELKALPNVTTLTCSTAQGVYDGNMVAVSEHRANGQVLHVVRARSIVYATGAAERPLIFANNDRPGVMLASAVDALLHRYALAPASRAVVATNNDSAYATAFALAEAGVAVTIAEQRAAPRSEFLARAAALGIAIFPASIIASVEGEKALRRVVLGGRHAASIEADVLAMSGGWSPNVHLTSHGGIKPVYDPAIAAFVPGGYAEGQFGAGAVTGGFGITSAASSGAAAGAKAVEFCGGTVKTHAIRADLPADAPYTIDPAWPKAAHIKGKAFVDFQNDVTVKDITTAHQEGFHSVEHLKRYTTLGMGTDQGKTSNINALALMADLRGLEPAAAGTTTFRPPYTPLTVGALAGRSVGHHFRAIRRSPLHDWHVANGGVFLDAGLWKRVWYYHWAGDAPETAYIKEMQLVRSGVGIADVSTLGKIDVQGPDAAEFLNRVYVNGFAKLPIGKARYGVMLNDDGVVLDDGTTSRISDTQYYMTTTTAQAGEVMSWLEYLLQCHWPDLRVHVASLTDEWGGMAVSGPQSRKALQLAFPDEDLSNDGLPYMGVKDFAFGGVQVRVLRLSFSGELAYEVHVTADKVTALWEHILKAAAPLSIKPYGLEALASLRIEKGHVAGLELDHRNTLDDLGLGKMAAKEKPFIGKELRLRENYQAPERWSLVGLELLEPEKKLRGASILFAGDDEIKGHGRGYITSVTWSTELQKFIALGLYNGGLKHEGEEIIAAFPLKNEQVRVKIVSPHFIDREGVRLNG